MFHLKKLIELMLILDMFDIGLDKKRADRKIYPLF